MSHLVIEKNLALPLPRRALPRRASPGLATFLDLGLRHQSSSWLPPPRIPVYYPLCVATLRIHASHYHSARVADAADDPLDRVSDHPLPAMPQRVSPGCLSPQCGHTPVISGSHRLTSLCSLFGSVRAISSSSSCKRPDGRVSRI